MDTLFWSQNVSPTAPNIIGIDGQIFEYKPDPKLDKAISILMDSSFGNSFKKDEFTTALADYDVSNNFMLVWNSNGLLIQSVFQNLDEGGTPLTYRLWCKKKDIEVTCNALEQYALSAEKELRINELENIKNIAKAINEKKLFKRKKKVFLISLFISVILLLLFIWKNF